MRSSGTKVAMNLFSNRVQVVKVERAGQVMARISIFFGLLLVFAPPGESLRLTKVTIPHYKLRGEMAILECDYELEGEILYSLKWYKDNEEFYRFVPKSDPPQYSYKLDGIKVDHELSDGKQVALRGVNLKSSGLYRCEVSAEAPSFSSAQHEARMEVVYLAKDGPHIDGEEKEFQVGDEIFLNCTSGKSFPESTLRWYVNEKQISRDEQLIRYPTVVHPHGLLTTVLGLRLPVTRDRFEGGEMKAKCVASMGPVFRQGRREGLPLGGRLPSLIDDREAHFLVRGSARESRPHSAPIFIISIGFFLPVYPTR